MSKIPSTPDSQRKARDKWNNSQAQIAIRVKPEIKVIFDEHCKSRKESLAGFLVRAALTQIDLDKVADADGQNEAN